MKLTGRHEHWQKVYASKKSDEVSWFQQTPETSLQLIASVDLPKDAAIIDVGGGDSRLVDHLIQAGFSDITVLDISETALERARQRLGEKANEVKWITADASNFIPERKYDLWHDRAAFHFLTSPDEIGHYVKTISEFVKPGGYLLMGTFAEDGPEKCSGLPVQRYSENMMTALLKNLFEKIKCFTEQHRTPFNTQQHFLFCSFRRVPVLS